MNCDGIGMRYIEGPFGATFDTAIASCYDESRGGQFRPLESFITINIGEIRSVSSRKPTET